MQGAPRLSVAQLFQLFGDPAPVAGRLARTVEKCSGACSGRFALLRQYQDITSRPVVHTRYNSSRKRRQLDQPAAIAVAGKDPPKSRSVELIFSQLSSAARREVRERVGVATRIGEWEPPGLRPPGIIAREPHSRSARVGPTIFLDRRQWTRPGSAVSQARPTRGIDSLHSYSTGTAGRGSRKFQNAIEMPQPVGRATESVSLCKRMTVAVFR
jgi:hypothetical protein